METSLNHIFNKMDQFDPVKYSSTRNFIDGSVSQLSPYISRGVISTKQVFQFLLDKGYGFSEMEKVIEDHSNANISGPHLSSYLNEDISYNFDVNKRRGMALFLSHCQYHNKSVI